jgi:hypothetical protein
VDLAQLNFARWSSAAMSAAVLIVAGGLAYEEFAEFADLRRYPPPGRQIDIGGRQLHLFCRGNGSPTVLIEAGSGSDSSAWFDVIERLSKITRACAYDRAGMGWSDAAAPRSIEGLVDDSQTLLTNAGIDGPLILSVTIGPTATRLRPSPICGWSS